LVVDDIATNLKVAEGLIAPYHARVDAALSGAEAIELVNRNVYDIIFMDHMMPGMDGVEAAAIIRASEGDYFKTVPIIALTANAVSGMREMFLSQGFNDFLAKPIDVSRLDDAIGKWLPREKQIKPGGKKARVNAPESQPPDIPGVDTAKGIAMTGGTEAGYRKVLAQFYKDAEERLALLQQPPEEPALPVFVTQVHALKSAAATIGAAEVSAEAAALEAAGMSVLAGNAADMTAIAEGLPKFSTGLSELVEAIGRAMKNEQGIMTNEENVDYVLFAANRALLKEALEAKDMKEIDRLLEEFEQLPLDAETRERINAVSDKILMGEYADAVMVIDAIT
jgi:CheY-like chemotaxis protein